MERPAAPASGAAGLQTVGLFAACVVVNEGGVFRFTSSRTLPLSAVRLDHDTNLAVLSRVYFGKRPAQVG